MPAQMLTFSETVGGLLDIGVLTVRIDNPPVNALSATVRAGLMAAIAHANRQPDIKGMVLSGAGRIFIGGADIREFGHPPAAPILPDVVDKIEQSGKPVIAAIGGAALGGGLEVALACHYRIASTRATFAFPEVKLGLVPGAGGTQRLPRLVGTSTAIDMVASGRTLTAAEALSNGLVDRISEDVGAEAASTIQGGANELFRRTGELAVGHESDDTVDQIVLTQVSKARGQAATTEAIRLVRAAHSVSLADGMADERNTFIRLRDSDEARALRHVFFAERESAKVDDLKDVAARPVETIGIVGLGLMGAGIATAALDAGYTVIGAEQTDEAAQKGLERIVGLNERNLKAGRIDEAALADRLRRLSVTGDMQPLSAADLVIEAVFDDLEVKTALFAALDAIVRPDAILATNTSYLDPDVIAAATTHPERVLGLHFFSPANVMRLLEVVRCARTAPDVLATGLAVGKRLRKLPVVSGVTEGFIGNSIFSAYRREAEYLLEDGALPEEIDEAMQAYGFAMGPFSVFDMAGLEIAWARRKRQAATRDPSERYVDIADRLCEAGRFGRKTGRGWYRYDDGRKTVDPDVTAMIESARAAKGIKPRPIAANEIVDRLLRAMAREGQHLLDTGIAARAGDIDLVLINGYGFPRHKGGPMYAHSLRPSA